MMVSNFSALKYIIIYILSKRILGGKKRNTHPSSTLTKKKKEKKGKKQQPSGKYRIRYTLIIYCDQTIYIYVCLNVLTGNRLAVILAATSSALAFLLIVTATVMFAMKRVQKRKRGII